MTLALASVNALPCPASAATQGSSALRVLNEGRIDQVVALLSAVVAANGRDSEAHLLLCRAYYSEDAADLAVTECEAAIANGGSKSSEAQDWMGRAYGAKADRSGPLAGYSLAKKVKASFEAAVALDPTSVAAANDLSEYYIHAPSIVGGGTDKALALADKIERTMPQAAHRMRGLVAANKKDYATAERELREAAATGAPVALLDLAAFYKQRGRTDESLATAHKAVEADKTNDAVLTDIASLLIEMHREPAEAARLLRAYLASPAKTDAGPTCRAHYLLGKLAANAGDAAGAKAEFQMALSLASKYEPARKALESK